MLLVLFGHVLMQGEKWLSRVSYTCACAVLHHRVFVAAQGSTSGKQRKLAQASSPAAAAVSERPYRQSAETARLVMAVAGALDSDEDDWEDTRPTNSTRHGGTSCPQLRRGCTVVRKSPNLKSTS
jgi:hypothetical protein